MKVTAPIHLPAPRDTDRGDYFTLPRVAWVLLSPFLLLFTIYFAPEVFLLSPFSRLRTTEAKLRGEQWRNIEAQGERLEAKGIIRSQAMIRFGYFGVLNLVQLGDNTMEFLGPVPKDGFRPKTGEGLRFYGIGSLQRVSEHRGTRYILGGSTFKFEFSDGALEICEILHATDWRNAMKNHPQIASKLRTPY